MRTSPNSLLDENSSSTRSAPFYKEFLAEREEILKNKWYLSEEAGCDVGFDAALIDWVVKHRKKWIANRAERISDC